jgi:predicted O-linked N-acetylglucosamine transferase (SPINDLY family)
MSDQAFHTALSQITAGDLSLSQLITSATGLVEAGQGDLAQQLYKVWVGFNPENPQIYVAHFNCGCLQNQMGDAAGATVSLGLAIASNPDFLPAYINLGGILERSEGANRAIELWMEGINRLTAVTGPSVNYKIAALKQLARVRGDGHQHDVAEAALQECLTLNPDQRDVLEQLTAVRLIQCKWPVAQPLENVGRQALVSSIHPLSMAAYTDDPLLQLAASSRYVERAVEEGTLPPATDRRHAPVDLTGRRLRIGYVSSDLREHAVGYLMSELLELHDRAKVEVFAYYCGIPSTDGLNTRAKAAVEHWRDIRDLSDEQAARQIEADGIDILVDVNGHTRDARTAVFARRPAPIQVNWLGYPGTMGSPYHHYMIADDFIVPPEFEIYCSERVVRLPCYQPNDRKRVTAALRPTRAQVGLPDDAMVFCSFNGTQKITRFTYDRWLEILRRTPGSVLWMLETSAAGHARLLAYAVQQGLDPARIILAPKLQNALHLARYPLADLFLDTSPYGAHTTASDALWMGVPLITVAGRSFASRVCGSLVTAAGLGELVCDTPEAFVERAVALGNDRPALEALKARLEAGRDTCDLFNMDKLAASLEGLYAGMALDYQQGRLPRPDLTNLDVYLAIGAEEDHEARETGAIEDYRGLYRDRLKARHRARPIPPDARFWSAEDAAG